MKMWLSLFAAFLLLPIIPVSAQFPDLIIPAYVPDLSAWEVHDPDRPQPVLVTPGAPGEAPSDAIVLFDGTDLSQWQLRDGSDASWAVQDGYMEVRRGSIMTRQSFGDVQLHIEWATPNSGDGQNSGNSGVYLMNTYEVQVLNSYENVTYPDGQAGAIYGQYPPLVNASRPPGEWQTYDIIFRRPRFDDEGNMTWPAHVTVLHNGVLIQNNATLTGPTGHRSRPPYKAHADKLPIQLQDHSEPTRYRNIWVREL